MRTLLTIAQPVTTAAAPRTSVHILGNLFGVGTMAIVFAGLMGAW
jgi:hypothetical protein